MPRRQDAAAAARGAARRDPRDPHVGGGDGRNGAVTSQAELRRRLRARGFKASQATLSRDMAVIGAQRAAGRRRPALPGRRRRRGAAARAGAPAGRRRRPQRHAGRRAHEGQRRVDGGARPRRGPPGRRPRHDRGRRHRVRRAPALARGRPRSPAACATLLGLGLTAHAGRADGRGRRYSAAHAQGDRRPRARRPGGSALRGRPRCPRPGRARRASARPRSASTSSTSTSGTASTRRRSCRSCPGRRGRASSRRSGPGVTEVAVGDRVAYAGLPGVVRRGADRAGRASGEAAARDRRQDGGRDDAQGDDGGGPAAALRARRARRHDPVPRRRRRRRQHRLPVGEAPRRCA